MPQASWNGVVIASAAADEVEIVEGNVYFPPGTVRSENLRPSDMHRVWLEGNRELL